MRRIDIAPYDVQVPNLPTPLKVVPVQLIEEVLNAGNYSPKALLDRMDLLKKLRSQVSGANLVVEDADYQKITDAMDAVQGFSFAHEQFLRNVYGAETVTAKVLDFTPKV
jgi:hypothetical protein